MTAHDILQHLKRYLLWAGLALCIYALWRSQALSMKRHEQLDLPHWIYAGFLLTLILLFAIASWRTYLRAYLLNEADWHTATRQLGLLLIGKYIPGGIFGFLLRIYDQPRTQRLKLLWASIADQSIGLGTTTLVAGVLMATASQRNWLWMILILPIPLLANAGIVLLHHCAKWVPWLSRHTNTAPDAHNGQLCLAASFQLCQAVTWAVLVAMLTTQLYDLPPYAAIGTAGAYLLAVGAGMLMVFLPGGIGAREAALTALASPWIDLPQALYLGALMRILTSLVDVAAGAGSATLGLWKRPESANH